MSDSALPPKDSPSDHEAGLFVGAPAHVRALYSESKRIRRLEARRSWWNKNGRQPRAAEQARPINNLEE